MGTPQLDTPGADEASLSHRPFRAWALQHDLTSLLGGDDWRPGTNGSATAKDGKLGGQAHLTRALATDPRLELRTRVSLMLWVSALITDVFNQVIPSEMGMPSGAFWITVGGVAAAILFTLVAYPRLDEARFNVVEQVMLGFACCLILYQCSVTRGAGSPYVLWFVLVTLYAGYLLPPVRAIWNIVAYGALAAGTFLLDQTVPSAATTLWVVTLILVLTVVAAALIRERRAAIVLDRTVKFLALADPLTGVANLRALEQFLDQMTRRDAQRFALVMVDMNGLKGANAVFGHEVGDGMIIRLSQLLLESSDVDAQVARIGGDEFAIVIPRDPETGLTSWHRRFDSAVDAHNAAIRGRLPRISVSVGSSTYPDDGLDARELLDVADRRMYEKKEQTVLPPYELDGEVASDPGHLLRTARFADAPTRVFDKRDRARLATINWLTLAVLTTACAFVDLKGVSTAGALACGAYAFIFAGLCEFGRARQMSAPLSIAIDVGTVLFVIPTVLLTGGAQSPILTALVLPISYYAQHFSTRFAAPRIAALIVFFTAAFWSYNAIYQVSLTTYGVLLAVMVIMAVVMQLSARGHQHSLAQIRESATHDPLTRLPNAYALRNDLAAAIRDAEASADELLPALVVGDIDNFRRVNTLAGHRGGDMALARVADQLAEINDGAKAYRVGGDEFAVLTTRAGSAKGLQTLADESLEAMSVTVPNGPGESVAITGAVAVAVLLPGQSADQMIESAEESLRDLKAKRKSGDSPGAVLL